MMLELSVFIPRLSSENSRDDLGVSPSGNAFHKHFSAILHAINLYCYTKNNRRLKVNSHSSKQSKLIRHKIEATHSAPHQTERSTVHFAPILVSTHSSTVQSTNIAANRRVWYNKAIIVFITLVPIFRKGAFFLGAWASWAGVFCRGAGVSGNA